MMTDITTAPAESTHHPVSSQLKPTAAPMIAEEEIHSLMAEQQLYCMFIRCDELKW
jgi:hypothetical protein